MVVIVLRRMKPVEVSAAADALVAAGSGGEITHVDHLVLP